MLCAKFVSALPLKLGAKSPPMPCTTAHYDRLLLRTDASGSAMCLSNLTLRGYSSVKLTAYKRVDRKQRLTTTFRQRSTRH